MIYADASAIARAYLSDEPDHDELRTALLEGPGLVVTSELSRVEVASAVVRAARGGRLLSSETVLAQVEADFDADGPLRPIAFRSAVVLKAAYELVVEHELRALDAIHLAVALEECPAIAGGDDVVFVTRDDEQAAAARALGLAVA